MKVLIVDDHPIVVSGCRALLAGMRELEVIAASSAGEGKRAFAEHTPDVTVVDINLPDVSGFELTRQLIAGAPEARILVFSMNDDPMYAAQALASGAKGYLSKNDDPMCFLQAITAVGAGEVYLAPALAERLERMEPAATGSAAATPQLTPRELEILRLLAKGRSMSEIAGLVSVSYKTVAGSCAVLRTKLNARTPMELVRIAVEHKIV